MNRILFVDDEPGILQGLRDALRKQRSRWEMVFVSSGAEALQALEQAPFDLVITDMRMPQMDGAELLQQVKARYPATARIVLSGQADQSAIMRALPVAHQFLSKPCDTRQLQSVIERTCGVYSMLRTGPAREVIGALDRLPSPPRTYTALRQAIDDPLCSIDQVVAIIERDPAMCVKVLQLVNSAYFGLSRSMSSIRQAVSYLGLELLKALALSVHIFSSAEAARLCGLDLEQLQRHSVRMARLMRRFFRDPKRADEAFTTGLVHDVGEIALALSFGERYRALRQQARDSGPRLNQAEAAQFGVTHAEVGAYLLGMWGLPFAVVEAVAYHHRPDACQSGPADAWLLAGLHVADALCGADCSGSMTAEAAINLEFIERAGCTGELPRWRQCALEQSQEEES